jgi:AraC family transcriptional regulator
MDGQYRTIAAISLAELRLERLVQDGSGPFRRAHLLEAPSLVHLPPVAGALGCFGEPHSHRSFAPIGETVVVPAHMPLHIRSPGFGPREMLVLRFDERQFHDLTGISAQSSAAELSACVDIRANAVARAIERLWIELAYPGHAQDVIVAGLGLQILGELARHFQGLRHAGRERGTLAEWQMRRIEARLAREDRPPPDIDELARLCGIGRRQLMRAWKATTGGTVMEHVERTRFARAAGLLETGQLPIKAIAAELGFAGQGSFATAFRRRFGDTPAAWRARRRSRLQ